MPNILPWRHEQITFERFMDFCLYDPEHGYYTDKERVLGARGDFYTSVHTHPVFAHTLADVIAHHFEILSHPKPFHLVELGAGEGILGRDLLARLQECHPHVFERASYVPIEVSAGELPDRIQGVVFSNEFFDALPVHRVCVRGSEPREIYLQINDQISEVEGDLSDSRIPEYMKEGFEVWREGHQYEVNLRMVEVLEDLDRRMDSGIILTVDYGYDGASYEKEDRAEGTLMCYRQHQVVSDPYADPGQQDITAHVNFQVMQKTGDKLGWTADPLITQREFLLDWGLEKRLGEEEELGLFNPDRMDDRLRLKSLLVPGGISDTMKVLLQKVRLD